MNFIFAGVVLTKPEYRLSFQLKMYESIQISNVDMSKSILEVLKWLNENVRNILDESDAILQPKYQLIYTVGNQGKSINLSSGVKKHPTG